MPGKFCELTKRYVSALAVAVAMLALSATQASAQITLPDTGVDMPGHITAAITTVGTGVVVVAGGYFAFLIVKKLFSWGRRAL